MSYTKVIPAPRGIIYDRTGTSLVHNEPSSNAFLLPRFLPKETAERTAAIERVGALLGLDPASVTARLALKDWNLGDALLLAADLPQDRLVELSAAALPWVQIEASFKRVEDERFTFSQVLGYAGLVGDADLKRDPSLSAEDSVGRAGLEVSYDRYLRGTDGEAVTFRDAHGNPEGDTVRKDPVRGSDLHTFIDAGLQNYFHDRLQQALTELGRDIGVGIALNPKTGEVLALVNIPGYDTAHLGEALTNPMKPLFNRAVAGEYNPGSTIKPLVALAALTEGVVNPYKQIFSAGYIDVPNPYFPDQPSRFLDWRPNGWVDVKSALAKSSNIYFYSVGGGFGDQKGLGIERLKEWWHKFLLDAPTGIDLNEEEKGFLPDPTWKQAETGEPWRLGDTFNVSIGQGDLLVTPIELLNYVAMIANGGIFYRPRIVSTVTTGASTTVFSSAPEVLADIRSEIADALPWVREGMRDVVREPYGSGYMMHDLPIAVSGKTGTAQTDLNQKVNAFFVGFAPSDDPTLAILVLVENAKEGSLNVLPVARDVFLWYDKHRIQNSK
jgi:penicillin-binding protein 2